MNQSTKNIWSLLLVVCSFAGGYAYYKMNPHDLVSPIAFGFGLMGILLSFLRNQK